MDNHKRQSILQKCNELLEELDSTPEEDFKEPTFEQVRETYDEVVRLRNLLQYKKITDL